MAIQVMYFKEFTNDKVKIVEEISTNHLIFNKISHVQVFLKTFDDKHLKKYFLTKERAEYRTKWLWSDTEYKLERTRIIIAIDKKEKSS